MVDWKDITKTEADESFVVGARVPIKYKRFIKDNKIDMKKLIMQACEELDNSLRTK